MWEFDKWYVDWGDVGYTYNISLLKPINSDNINYIFVDFYNLL